MSRSAPITRPVFVSLTLLSFAAWWGCAKAAGEPTTQASSVSSASSSGASSGSGGGGGAGGGGMGGGGPVGGGGHDAGPCVSTSALAHHAPLDIVFLIDQSSSMEGANWTAVTK